MEGTRRAGRGLRAGRIVGRFNELVVVCRQEFSLQDDVLAESIETGVSTTDSTMVIVDISRRGVARGCNCVSP